MGRLDAQEKRFEILDLECLHNLQTSREVIRRRVTVADAFELSDRKAVSCLLAKVQDQLKRAPARRRGKPED